MKGNRTPKTNGFSHGLNFHQIVSYMVLIAKIFSFGYFFTSNFHNHFKILFSVLYYPVTFMVVLFGFLATISDPTDIVVKMERKSRITGEPFDSSKYEFHCEVCSTSVSNDTKHCRTCERCVNGFDHHCEWVNNCVSKRNYKVFVAMILNLAISTFIFSLTGTLFTLDYYTGKLGLINERGFVRSEPRAREHIIFIMAFSLINLILLLLDMRLIVFHYYLYKNNLTTYEYIVKGREKLRERKSKKRSSLMLRGNRKMSPKQMPEQDPEDPKDLSLHDAEYKAQKLTQADKFRLLGNLAFGKLTAEGSSDEGASSKELKNDSKPSNPPSSLFASEKPLRIMEKSGSGSMFLQEQSANSEYNLQSAKDREHLVEDRETYDLQAPGSTSSPKHKLDLDAQLSSARLIGHHDALSPTASARDSMQELAGYDLRDSKEFDGLKVSINPNGQVFESRLVAVSLARIVNNYMPKYGKILEEEIESERPTNISDVTLKEFVETRNL